MQSNLAKALVAVVSVVAVVVLFVVLSDGDGEPGEPPTAVETEQQAPDPAPEDKARPEDKDGGEGEQRERPELVRLRVLAEQGDVESLEYGRGDRVRLLFASDVTEEIHVHGYDIYVDVSPGSPEQVSFAADLDGVFEIEAHGSGVQIARLIVTP